MALLNQVHDELKLLAGSGGARGFTLSTIGGFVDLYWQPMPPLHDLSSVEHVRIQGQNHYAVIAMIEREYRYFAGHDDFQVPHKPIVGSEGTLPAAVRRIYDYLLHPT